MPTPPRPALTSPWAPRRGALVLALALAGSAPARAQDMPSTPSRGMAGAGSARVDDTTAVARNPAALLLGIRYGAQADFGFGAGLYGRAALVDTRTSDFGAGVSWTGTWASPPLTDAQMPGWLPEDGTLPDNPMMIHSVRGAVGYGLLRVQHVRDDYATEIRRLAFGLGGSWDRSSSTLGGIEQDFDLGVSVAGRPLPELSLALSARDLLPTGDRPPSVELGAAWMRPMGVLAADLAWDPALGERPLAARLGGELVLAEKVPLRAGYALEGAQHTVGAGFGIAAPTTRLDYAVNLCVVGDCAGLGEWGFLTHSVGVMAVF